MPSAGAKGGTMSGYSPAWLGLREAADAEGRSLELLDALRRHLSDASPLVIRDLGCGTGSMGRWLAGRLPGPQHWIMYDSDAVLLDHAAASLVQAADSITVETRQDDVTRLSAADLAGASLVTASALLDLLTLDEVHGLAAACVGAACPALLVLSVVGRVELTPAGPRDAEIAVAFNAHQRRTVEGGRRLCPDSAPASA